MEYNMERLERFIFGQGGPSLYTYLATHTVQEFLDEVSKYEEKVNPKQSNLIELYHDRKSDDWQYRQDRTKILEKYAELKEREWAIMKREMELDIKEPYFNAAGWHDCRPETENSVKESNSNEEQQERLYPGGAADRRCDHCRSRRHCDPHLLQPA
jgi:hypothetical protein